MKRILTLSIVFFVITTGMFTATARSQTAEPPAETLAGLTLQEAISSAPAGNSQITSAGEVAFCSFPG